MKRTAAIGIGVGMCIVAGVAGLCLWGASSRAADGPAASQPAGKFAIPREWTFDSDDETYAKHQVLIGKPAPKLEMEGWINGQVSDKDMQGKIVLVDVWATWCGPCLRAIPHNNEMAKKYAEQGVLVIGVCGTESGQEKLPAVAADRKIAYPVGKDAKLEIGKAYAVSYWPTNILVDRKGIVRAVGINTGKVEEALKLLLKEQPPEEKK